MNERELLQFIERVIHNCGGDEVRLKYSLGQLKAILEEQNANVDVMKMISQAAINVPELSDFVNKQNITMDDLEEANKRGRIRRLREEEMKRGGRC